MEMAYRERWGAEIAELRQIPSGLGLTEARKWGKPCYTLDGRRSCRDEACWNGDGPGGFPSGLSALAAGPL